MWAVLRVSASSECAGLMSQPYKPLGTDQVKDEKYELWCLWYTWKAKCMLFILPHSDVQPQVSPRSLLMSPATDFLPDTWQPWIILTSRKFPYSGRCIFKIYCSFLKNIKIHENLTSDAWILAFAFWGRKVCFRMLTIYIAEKFNQVWNLTR